ncbi:NAD-dependent epimerase/dehydratase family protein [Alkalicoccus chagannorensis]|uniref:NAD-dependent epimerase/dehydratase family protein n=1 Tax=Alkalicoccus chagannorensis TaxID=427072 RepID=UPI0003FA2687|nr:NAD-dependent epimerase/dehydratase family protein [Alkalicoccus chagannorensis]
MKKILITGSKSYVGKSVESWLKQYPNDYSVHAISVRDNSWKNQDFSEYDVVLHVAGIAHRKETKENKNLYYKINRDLTLELAQKAKKDGVSHFIFISSMSVYGIEKGVIDRHTKPKPKSHYGISKLEAENELMKIGDESFNIAIVRPPMIYGKDCPGNYEKLSVLAKKSPIFPAYQNERSMLYVDNLSAKLETIIIKQSDGLFLPQDYEYVNTTGLVKEIAEINGTNIILTNLFNPLIKFAPFSITKKVFGTLIYDKSISELCETFSRAEAVRLSEGVK